MNRKIFHLLTVSIFAAVSYQILPQAETAVTESILSGKIVSASGQALDGIVVSAREDGSTITTSVFTDDRGAYVFPPLGQGTYRVWAQAVGFATSNEEISLTSSSDIVQDFTLAELADFSKQLSGSEWMASLPDDTRENRRLKHLFRNNCAGCHTPNFVLQNRFDRAGWIKIIDVMETIGIYGNPPRDDVSPFPLIRHFKEELADYLTSMRGPETSPMKFKPFPRPRGETARVVITEYDYTSSSNPDEYVTHDGSNWMEGAPSAYEARGPHDAEVDSRGNVWIVDSQRNPVRTIAKLDPATGKITNFKLDADHGVAKRSHGIVIDQNDIAWFNADVGLGKINTRNEKLEWFEPPKGMAGAGGTLDVDNEGMIWVSSSTGAFQFNPDTNTFRNFLSKSKGSNGRTYGVAADADGNGWWAQMNYDKLGVGNPRTGEITEVAMQPVPGLDEIITDSDRKIFEFAGSDWNSATAWSQSPRRLGADKKGDTVWVANWWGGNLAKIDIKTHKVTYYPYPGQGFPGIYDTTIDRDGMVWINLMNADRVARFDPKTEQWTEFQLPSLGTESRFIAVDNHKDRLEVWVPYWRTQRIARIQFRTEEELRSNR